MKFNIDQINRSRFTPGVALVCLLVLFITVLPAQETTPVYVDVSQCRNITVDQARVACYDALADQASNQSTTSSQSAVSGRDTPAQGSTYNYRLSEENMKMRQELARLRRAESGGGEEDRLASYGKPGPRIEEEDGKEIFYDRIAGLQKITDGWVVTLEKNILAFGKRRPDPLPRPELFPREPILS